MGFTLLTLLSRISLSILQIEELRLKDFQELVKATRLVSGWVKIQAQIPFYSAPDVRCVSYLS